METIPGSAQELLPGESVANSSCDATLSNPQTTAANAAYWNTRRWERFDGKQPPMTPARIAAIAEKRIWEKRGPKTDDERKCYASGVEMGAAIASGALRPFAFDEAIVIKTFPKAYAIRRRQLALVGLIAAVVFAPRWKRFGVIATQAELGMLIGIRYRRTRTLVGELVAWGLLEDRPTFQPFRAVHNRRANCYELSAALYTALLPRDRARARMPGNAEFDSGLPGNPDMFSLGSGLDKDLSGECRAIVLGSPDEPATRLPDESAIASCPGTRQGETPSVSEAASTGRVSSLREALAETDTPFARKLLAELTHKTGGAS